MLDRRSLYSYITVPLLTALAWMAGCSSTVAGGGSGTGTGNPVVVGRVMLDTITPLANGTIRLRPQTFLPDTSGRMTLRGDGIVTSTTDAQGYFVIDSVDTQFAYSLEVNSDEQVDASHTAVGTLYKFAGDSTDTIHLGTRISTQFPTLKATILVAGLPANSYVQIYGLERIAKTDSQGRFEVNELPRGECEHNECEYKIQVLIPQAGGGYIARHGEFEITTVNGNIVQTEVELN